MVTLIKSNYAYAAHRRQLENGHEPFEWDDWEYDHTPPDKVEPVAVPVTPPKQEKVSRHGRHRTRERRRGSADPSAETRDTGSQTPSWNVDNGSHELRSNRQGADVGHRKETVADTAPIRQRPQAGPRPWSTHVKSGKAPLQARTWVQMPAPAWRPSSEPTETVAADKSSRYGGDNLSNNPFAQYGTADDELDTGGKRTFNVRADDEIYKSALRAKKRQEVHVHQQLEAERREPLAARRRKALFNDDFDLAMNKETAKWTSEYNRNYRGWRHAA